MKSGHKYKTSEAVRLNRKKHYVKKAKRIKKNSLIGQNNRRFILASLIRDYKTHNPCVECGENDPIVLDFDHRNPAEKLFNISSAINKTRDLSIVCAEIAKCDIRCSNCHRRRTFHEKHGVFKNRP